jgi:hypothetical protein
MVNKALTGEGSAGFLTGGFRAFALQSRWRGLQAARAGATFP